MVNPTQWITVANPTLTCVNGSTLEYTVNVNPRVEVGQYHVLFGGSDRVCDTRPQLQLPEPTLDGVFRVTLVPVAPVSNILPMAVVIGAVCGGVGLLVLVIVVAIFLRWRLKQKGKGGKEGSEEDKEALLNVNDADFRENIIEILQEANVTIVEPTEIQTVTILGQVRL